MHPVTSFPVRALGTTDMFITRVGFGAWALGGGDWARGWGAQNDADSIAAIQHAVRRGINWIDTAAVYGLGHSETIIGEALKGLSRSERPLIFTKGGLRWNDHDRQAAPRRVGDPDSLREEIDASLERLGVETIDLYQMHWPADDGTPVEAYWQVLLDAKRSGKVRAVGLSNHNVAQLEAAERLGHVDTLQPPFSAIQRSAADDLLPWCERHDTGVIVYSPMQSGLLTGTMTPARVQALGHDDWRAGHVEYTSPRLERNLALADAMKPLAQRHGATTAAVAIAWTLTWPGVTGAIVGARSPAQVDDWLAAATLELDDDDLDVVAEAIARTGAGVGPARPPRREDDSVLDILPSLSL